ncbi:TetR/AcrR family tetracycline transcriptional repressor [Curtobacterium flaccumfaciens]|nr:TetR/AcrR family transcriptional regulator C-terminal domain-containing protein [Curtobacterium flaccumfaciens]MDD1386800.1 TetR/AcrR family transcriptional regulator C-terminal domain-containing protein [Curtobacterium flaccumfaciens pv. poinsettiae]MDQ0540955.1 TetR/AcrR family tetracycline transcriptional repressor [Curtobacterium flaccumfaciens]
MSSRGLSRDAVAATALRLIDDVGLPDFTMRRLAASLGVQASAIYWHFPNKQAVLAELADHILSGEQPAGGGGDWPNRLRREASALREALLTYRDSAEIVASTMALGLGSDRGMRRLTGALDSSPFSAEDARRAAAAMLHFILGHVSLEQQRLLYDSLGAREGEPAMLHDRSKSDDFCFGVQTIVSGLEIRATSPA